MDPDLQERIETWTPDPRRRPSDQDWFPPIFEHAPFGIAAVDFHGNFVRVNAAFCELHGQPASSFVLASLGDVSSPERTAEYEATLARARAGELTTYQAEHRINRPDGQERWALISASTVFDELGEPIYALVQYHETTDVHQAADEAKRKGEALEITFDNAPIAIYSVDLEGNVRSWNSEAERIYGWTADEIVGERIPIVLDYDAAREWHRQLLASGSVAAQDGTARHKDGHTIDVIVSAALTHNAAGEPHEMVAFAMDVTRQRQTERALEQREREMRTIFAKISDSVTVIDATGNVKYSTAEFSDVLGYDEDFWREHNALELVHPDDLPLADRLLQDALDLPRVELNDVLRLRDAAGDYAPIEVVGMNLLDDSEVEGIVLTTRNLTEFRRAQMLLADEARILGLIARNADLDRTLEAITEMVERNTDGGTSAIVLITAEGRVTVGAAPRIAPELFADVEGSEPFGPIRAAIERRELIVVRDVPTDETSSHLVNEARTHHIAAGWVSPIIESTTLEVLGAICTYYASERDPSAHELEVSHLATNLAAIAIDRDQAHTELSHRAHHDDLTGLPNRALVLRRLREALTADGATGGVVVMFLDLDRFKVVNDSLGHLAGDHLLVALAERLEGALPPGAFLGRHRADEFVVIHSGISRRQDAIPLARRLQHVLADPFRLPEGEVVLAASVGVAHSSDGTCTAEQLIERADAAMFRAKQLGRNRIEVFDDQLRTRARQRMQLEQDLRVAIEQRHFEVYYQPEIDLSTGRICGAEALLRWHHPDRGLVLPDEFIPLAEETGLVVQIGRFVLEEAVAQARKWAAEYSALDSFVISVNFSPRQLSAPDLIDNIARVLVRNDWPADRLAVELTETVLVDDAEHALERLRQLKSLGLRLAIDDFGTGYSSLSYLHRFPVDMVKIDRAFVSEIRADGSGSAVAQAVMHMAGALDLITAAEGVEDDDQLVGLRALGCAWAQGFHFARPLPAAELTDLLASDPHW